MVTAVSQRHPIPATIPVLERPVARPARLARLTALLTRSDRENRWVALLPVLAFAVSTAIMLVVAAGVQMFAVDPRAGADDMRGMYVILACLALLMLVVPIGTLGAAAARLTSRLRNDRLATLRLLGATNSEVSVMAVAEASLLALVGAGIGVVMYVAALPLLGLIPFFGDGVGAQAMWAGPWITVGVVVGVTLIAAFSAMTSLRRVRLTPLGVRRRTEAAPVRWRAMLLGLLGVVATFAAAKFAGVAGEVWGIAVFVAILLGTFGVAMLLINVIGGPIVAARGRAIARKASTTARLVGGRELAEHAGVAWRRVSGIAMVTFIAVVGGSGAALMAAAEGDSPESGTLISDIRVGVVVTVVAGFVMAACTTWLTQAAAVFEDAELIVGMDRMGVPTEDFEKARALTVTVPLRWATVGGVAVALFPTFPVVGMATIMSPVTIGVVAVAVVAGWALVWASTLATRPLYAKVRRDAARA